MQPRAVQAHKDTKGVGGPVRLCEQNTKQYLLCEREPNTGQTLVVWAMITVHGRKKVKGQTIVYFLRLQITNMGNNETLSRISCLS